ncbi:hypothetical protein A8C56_13950 [Niabella ginsenosidivorans]|uniref:FAD dependent oxidoreductase domain-containing protein n=1 Tax=Niabella ginsenosidivorans TaxID=1176587 RepID=A0A1A9I2T3_9BACT|nr:FAD-dependent oxidoreductase [Niabella ginsenosidivorans]ANH81926.1 hypothetical protein A8C56_13950 [Niabella ginsenosidivorans]
MHLRTTESFWLLKNGLLHSYPSLQEDLAAEIIIIGGGVTGALISHALLNQGYEVVILDKRDAGQGSTAATTAMLQYEIDVPLYKLAGQIGEKEAVDCYRAGIEAIDTLAQLIHDEQIDCGFHKKQSLYYAHNKKAAGWLLKEYEIRNRYQLGVQWLTADEIHNSYRLKTYGGILSEKGASMDAYRFTQQLIYKNIRRGLRIFDHTFFEKIDYSPSGATIYLENGHKARCKRIVFCSGFETVHMFPEKTASLFSTFACVSECAIKVPPALSDVLVWNTEDPYLYLRTTDDGRLLIGGEDSQYNSGVLREQLKEKKSKRLLKKLNAVLPGVAFTEDFSWAGCFGSTKDGLPYIGTHTQYPGAYFVLGFGGNGITFSVQGMQLIQKLLTNEPDTLLYYYRFGR